MKKELWRTTAGEDIWLRRKSCDQTAEVFAKRLGVCRTTLWRIEGDERQHRGGLPLYGPHNGVALLCALARRRAGLPLSAIEKAMGRSRPTVLALEKAGADEMVNFWRARGFKFPK